MATPYRRTLLALHADRPGGEILPAVLGAALIGAWIAWLFLAEVGVWQEATRARIEQGGPPVSIQTEVSAKVASVAVALGERVEVDQLLIQLEDTRLDRRLTLAKQRVEAIDLQLDVLKGEQVVSGAVDQASREASSAARQALAIRIQEAGQSAQDAQNKAEEVSRLAAAGVMTEAEAQEAEAQARATTALSEALARDLAELDAVRSVDEGQRLAAQSSQQRLEQRLLGERAAVESEIALLADQLSKHALRAPTSGTIGDLARLAPGALVNPGQPIAALIPDGPPHIVAWFPVGPAGGRLQPGQRARLEVASYPWAVYGAVTAEVVRVAREPRDGLLQVELVPTGDAPFPLIHGLEGHLEVEVERTSPAARVLGGLGAS